MANPWSFPLVQFQRATTSIAHEGKKPWELCRQSGLQLVFDRTGFGGVSSNIAGAPRPQSALSTVMKIVAQGSVLDMLSIEELCRRAGAAIAGQPHFQQRVIEQTSVTTIVEMKTPYRCQIKVVRADEGKIYYKGFTLLEPEKDLSQVIALLRQAGCVVQHAQASRRSAELSSRPVTTSSQPDTRLLFQRVPTPSEGYVQDDLIRSSQISRGYDARASSSSSLALPFQRPDTSLTSFTLNPPATAFSPAASPTNPFASTNPFSGNVSSTTHLEAPPVQETPSTTLPPQRTLPFPEQSAARPPARDGPRLGDKRPHSVLLVDEQPAISTRESGGHFSQPDLSFSRPGSSRPQLPAQHSFHETAHSTRVITPSAMRQTMGIMGANELNSRTLQPTLTYETAPKPYRAAVASMKDNGQVDFSVFMKHPYFAQIPLLERADAIDDFVLNTLRDPEFVTECDRLESELLLADMQRADDHVMSLLEEGQRKCVARPGADKTDGSESIAWALDLGRDTPAMTGSSRK